MKNKILFFSKYLILITLYNYFLFESFTKYQVMGVVTQYIILLYIFYKLDTIELKNE